MIGYIKSLFGVSNEEETYSGLTVLEDLLAEREATLRLEAEYERPTVNTTGEPTAVFPITLFHEGDEYGATVKEFPLPDNGLDELEADLTQFVGEANGLLPEEVMFSDLSSIEGMSAEARLTEEGEIVVDAPKVVGVEE